MRLVEELQPFSWSVSRKHVDEVRHIALRQFLYQYKQHKDREDDPFKWGDEIEAHLIKFDHEKKVARLSLRAIQVLRYLNQISESESAGEWSEEATESMVESSPRGPFGDVFESCLLVEENMRARRKEIFQALNPDETYLTISVFPRFGQKDFAEPLFKPTPDKGIFKSSFVADETLCSQNQLYRTMTINAEEQRGHKLYLNVPIFQDANTPKPFLDGCVGADSNSQSEGALPDCIFGDCCLFGLSLCALQVTVQAPNLEDAKHLYDHLTVLSPIMMALTAAVPTFRGFLTERDCRFKTLSDAADTRTKMEKEKPDQLGYTVIPCSRWEPVSFYLSTDHTKLNDIPIVYNEKYFDQLVNSGVDPQLARLVSRSLTRDPLFVSEKQLEEDETETFNLLIALLSTTFPTVRLKIPDASNSAFWRLEFRPMEVQFTDYENAAFSLFMVILAKIILEKKLHLLIPISKVLENVERAQKRDAVRNEKFWMKSNFQDDDSGWEELTVDEVINGKDPDHVGLVSVIRQYMSESGVDNNVAESLERYLRLVQGRASGELMTDSRWIREFVTSHDDYKHDSYITDKINYDLLLTIDKIQRKEISCSQLLGE